MSENKSNRCDLCSYDKQGENQYCAKCNAPIITEDGEDLRGISVDEKSVKLAQELSILAEAFDKEDYQNTAYNLKTAYKMFIETILNKRERVIVTDYLNELKK